MNKKNKLSKTYAIGVAACTFFVCIDQWTKYLAVTFLRGNNGISLWEGIFRFYYLENRGAAFGIFQDQKVYFIVSAVFILLLFGYCYFKMPLTKHYLPLRVCCVLLSAGAIGNLIDRIKLNYVVDFLYFELIDFPIFNVADMYVVTATLLLAFLILFYYKEEEFTFLFSKRNSKE
ncbi:MAG: signal peptidase II [Lachnospiraceae bacterium]